MAGPSAGKLSWALALVVLFFGQSGLAETAQQGPASQVQEMQVVLAELRAENRQQQAALGRLQRTVAALQAENQWLRQQSELGQVRQQMLGAGPATPELQTVQRHLLEAVRQLSLVEAAQRRLREQVRRLLNDQQARQDLTPAWAALAALLEQMENAKPQRDAASEGLATAEVVDVNHALGAVVLGVGSEQGVRMGMPFAAWRGDRQVAVLRVVEVRPRLCAALIERVEQNVRLRAGDSARVTQTTAAELQRAQPGNEKEFLWKSKR